MLRRYIPKADGKQRPLGIPTVKDRVVQTAAKLILEPIFEADFLPSSFGFRPRRSTLQALETIRETVNAGSRHVLDADIRDYFGTIDQTVLMERVTRRVSDRRVLKLLRGWLQAGVKDVDVLIHDLNPMLRGWGGYFSTGNAARKFLSLDKYVVRRLNMFRWRRHRRHAKPGQRIHWEREDYEARGLYRLRGTVRYPKPCMLHREVPPVSRVRETRTHGLKGGGGDRAA